MTRTKKQKPQVSLIGKEGNTFAILGECRRVALQAGMTKEKWEKIYEKMTHGDYNHLLRTVQKYFIVK